MLRAVIHHTVAVARDLDDDLVADAGVDGRTVRISDGVLNARLGEVLIHAFLTVAVNGSERCFFVGVKRLISVYLCLGVLAVYIAVAFQVELTVSSGLCLGRGKLDRVAQLNGGSVGNVFAYIQSEGLAVYSVNKRERRVRVTRFAEVILYRAFLAASLGCNIFRCSYRERKASGIKSEVFAYCIFYGRACTDCEEHVLGYAGKDVDVFFRSVNQMICRRQIAKHSTSHIISASQIAIIAVITALKFSEQLCRLITGNIRINDYISAIVWYECYTFRQRAAFKCISICFKIILSKNFVTLYNIL